MCGIIGLISDAPVAEMNARVHAGMAALAHRGPDGEGYWSSPFGTVALGHRRLRILDLTDAAAQPMIADAGRRALTYNGEIYNYAELRERLRDRGIQPRSSGDTEILFHWLAEYSEERLRELQGMYAFGFWNQDSQRLLLARDPLGIKPLYYARLRLKGHQVLLFGSEVRAMLATGLVSRRISPAGIHGYLAWGSVPSPQSILAEIEELPPGHWLAASPAGDVRIERFWRPCYPKAPRRPAAGEAKELREKLQDAVRLHRVSDVPAGAFLSGGLDSSVITAMLALDGPRPRTLTVTFPDAPGLDEAGFSDAVAQRYATEHHHVAVSFADSLDLCRRALDAQDQPSSDGVNTFIVAWAARQSGLTVALSGLGADELFGGYPSFRDVPGAARWLRRMGQPGQALLTAALTPLLCVSPFDRRLQKLEQLAQAPRSLTGVYSVRRRIFPDRQLTRLVRGLERMDRPEWREWEEETLDWAEADAVSWLEMRSYMGNTLLRDADAMGMAHGLEIRLPYLHQPLLDWTQEQGPPMRRTVPYPKQALLEAVGELVPEVCWRRPKQGFALPFEAWLLGPLRPSAEEVLMNPPGTAFPKAELRSLWQAWLRNPRQVGWARIWSLYALFCWMDRNAVTFDGMMDISVETGAER